ncbi:glycosyltransferase family 39 protein [Candidatus Pacearchaeota archaeon]|nr:glycosyltransferase family 39 protein [Candidatus Pacearchaeota archaeon]
MEKEVLEHKNKEAGTRKKSFINVKFDKFLGSVIDIAYSKDKYIERWLIILLVIGFILRLIASLNLGVLADDMVYASQSAGIWSAKILSTHSNPPLFFYLTDLSYKTFGYTTFASRFWALIPGTLLIFLSFLISKRLFNKEIALFTAFFVTFSTFLIRMSFTEMSLLVLFFSMFGVYSGMLFLESRKNKFLFLSAFSFGLGVLTKYNAPFFIIAFLVYSVYFLKDKKEKIVTKKNIYQLTAFLAIIFVFALPFLAFNYLLYKDRGLTDVYFSRIIQTEKTQEFYAGLAGQERSFFDNALNFDSYGNTTLVYRSDLILFIFAVLA